MQTNSVDLLRPINKFLDRSLHGILIKYENCEKNIHSEKNLFVERKFLPILLVSMILTGISFNPVG